MTIKKHSLQCDPEHRVSGLSSNKLHERLINVSQTALLIGIGRSSEIFRPVKSGTIFEIDNFIERPVPGL